MFTARRFTLLFLIFVVPSSLFSQENQKKFPYQLYFGETHNHSIFSFDYKGPEEKSEPIDAYRYARYRRGYDFFVISDHNFERMERTLHRKGRRQAEEATEEGKFVAIYGTEFNKGMEQQGHINIFDSPVLFSWEYEDVYVEQGDIEGLYRAIDKNPGEFGPAAQFNHPFAVNFNEFEYDETGALVMKLIEASNGKHNSSTYEETLEMYHENIQTALSKGWKLGFSASDDHHDHGWGTVYSETTGLFAKSLTKKDIIDAIQNRRSYGMNDVNARAIFLINGQMLGSVFTQPDGKLKFYVKIIDSDPYEGIENVVFYCGVPGSNQKPEILKEMDGVTDKENVFRFEHNQPLHTTYYYYPRATQKDGNFIMMSPIWVIVP